MVILPARNRADGYTSLLLHFDGADTSTATYDMSRYSHAITFVGDAVIDTAQNKFGVSSLELGTGDGVSIPAHSCFKYYDGDFSAELWVRFASLPATDTNCLLYAQSNGLQLLISNVSDTYSLIARNGNSTVVSTAVITPSAETWYHAAVARSGTTVKLFFGGSVVDTDTYSGSFEGTDANIGPVNSWIDEVRISKGIARWTANFTVPSAAYR